MNSILESKLKIILKILIGLGLGFIFSQGLRLIIIYFLINYPDVPAVSFLLHIFGTVFWNLSHLFIFIIFSFLGIFFFFKLDNRIEQKRRRQRVLEDIKT